MIDLRKALIAGAVAGTMFGGSIAAVNAATDGTAGSTSTGTLDIQVSIPQLARISQLDDMLLGNWDGINPMQGTDDACVWSTTGAYQITATGDGAANAFTITDGANTIAYSVEFADSAGQTTGTAMTTNVALTGQATTATTTDCNGGAANNASVIVNFAVLDLAAAPAGTYNGTLTLVVAPE